MNFSFKTLRFAPQSPPLSLPYVAAGIFFSYFKGKRAFPRYIHEEIERIFFPETSPGKAGKAGGAASRRGEEGDFRGRSSPPKPRNRQGRTWRGGKRSPSTCGCFGVLRPRKACCLSAVSVRSNGHSAGLSAGQAGQGQRALPHGISRTGGRLWAGKGGCGRVLPSAFGPPLPA